ncbi:MAG: hypothetical protein CME58_04030 [Halieaceae bacterium]|nr:hypothetical protein [Halieaceae bacterium]
MLLNPKITQFFFKDSLQLIFLNKSGQGGVMILARWSQRHSQATIALQYLGYTNAGYTYIAPIPNANSLVVSWRIKLKMQRRRKMTFLGGLEL